MQNNAFNNQPLPDKLPPQSPGSEKCLLGCLLLDKDAIWKVIDFLRAEDFYKRKHQQIYQAMQELTEKKEPIDIETLSVRLQEKGLLEEIGGYSYLTELVTSVPTASNVLAYAKIVQRKRILRDLISASYEIGRLGYTETEDVADVLDKAEKIIFAIAQKGSTQQFAPIKSVLEQAYERLENLSAMPTGGISGVPVGFPKLDNLLAGLQKSDLIILASRPSMGKSSLALDFARYAAVQHKKIVGIFSLEMSKEQVVDRLLASQSRINLWKIRTGRLSRQGSPNDFETLNNALDILSQAPIFIDDTPSPTILQMKAMARRLQAEHGLDLLIIDYLQLIQPVNLTENMVQQITRISRSLKDMARELSVPVLAISQLSRAVEQRTPPIPRLADLRESGSLEQDSDVVLLIDREDKYKQDALPGDANIIVAKHRNGPIGRVPVFFNESIVSFEPRIEEEMPEGLGEETATEEPEL